MVRFVLLLFSGVALLSLLTTSAAAQEASVELTFEPESHGRTLFKVLEPEDAACTVAEGGLSRRYSVPFSIPAREHSFYKFTCRLPDGTLWTRTLEPRPQQVNIIRVKGGAAAQPKTPTAMDAPSFNALTAAIEREGFSDGKLRVIQQAAASGYFTIAQVGQIVQLIAFSDDKVSAVWTLKPRVIDPQNASQLQSLFSFSSDKEKVQAIFAR